jgi:hypothetical protein
MVFCLCVLAKRKRVNNGLWWFPLVGSAVLSVQRYYIYNLVQYSPPTLSHSHVLSLSLSLPFSCSYSVYDCRTPLELIHTQSTVQLQLCQLTHQPIELAVARQLRANRTPGTHDHAIALWPGEKLVVFTRLEDNKIRALTDLEQPDALGFLVACGHKNGAAVLGLAFSVCFVLSVPWKLVVFSCGNGIRTTKVRCVSHPALLLPCRSPFEP